MRVQTLTSEDYELINELQASVPTNLIEAVLSDDPNIQLYYDAPTLFRAMFAYEEAIRSTYSPMKAERMIADNAVLAAFRRALETEK